MSKNKQLHINLQNIRHLNHFVHTHTQMFNTVGKSYTTLGFHNTENTSYDNSWQYEINEYGYRGNRWTFDKNSIAFFGCSITFGIGVKTDIASLIEKNMHITCHNIGQPGASAPVILKTFEAFNSIHPTKVAVITLPQMERIFYPTYEEGVNEWRYISLLPSYVDHNIEKIHGLAYQFFNRDVCAGYLVDYIKLAQLSAKVTNTRLIWSSWDLDTFNFLKEYLEPDDISPVGHLGLDKARDGVHPGPKFVTSWADILAIKIKEYL